MVTKKPPIAKDFVDLPLLVVDAAFPVVAVVDGLVEVFVPVLVPVPALVHLGTGFQDNEEVLSLPAVPGL